MHISIRCTGIFRRRTLHAYESISILFFVLHNKRKGWAWAHNLLFYYIRSHIKNWINAASVSFFCLSWCVGLECEKVHVLRIHWKPWKGRKKETFRTVNQKPLFISLPTFVSDWDWSFSFDCNAQFLTQSVKIRNTDFVLHRMDEKWARKCFGNSDGWLGWRVHVAENAELMYEVVNDIESIRHENAPNDDAHVVKIDVGFLLSLSLFHPHPSLSFNIFSIWTMWKICQSMRIKYRLIVSNNTRDAFSRFY